MKYNRIKNNEKNFFHLLFILDRIVKQHNIDYWLDCGSLIGAIREGTYIKWDNDMDISIHFKDAKKVRKLKDEFKKYNISLGGFVSLGITYKNSSMCIFPLHTVKRNGKKYLVQYRYPLYYWINKFIKKISPEFNLMLKQSKFYIFLCSKIKILETIRSPLNNLGNFSYISFCNTVCPVPEYPDKYLTYMFDDWRTPHKFYKHSDIENMYNVKIYK